MLSDKSDTLKIFVRGLENNLLLRDLHGPKEVYVFGSSIPQGKMQKGSSAQHEKISRKQTFKVPHPGQESLELMGETIEHPYV